MGTASFKEYGASITVTADVTLAKDYVEIDYTKGVSSAAVTITPADGGTATTATGKNYAKVGSEITIAAATANAKVTVKDSDNAYLKDADDNEMNAKEIASGANVKVTAGEKNITITDIDA